MTIRSVILGLLGAMLIAVLAYFNDHVWVLSSFVGSHLPIFVFGMLILTALVLNPLVGRFHRSWRLRPPELAVIVLMTMVACSIPSFGFMGTFVKSMVMPAQQYAGNPGWQKNQILDYYPEGTLPADGQYVPEFTDPGLSGAGSEDNFVSFSEVPMRFWEKPLTIWLPLTVLFTLSAVCIGMIVHQQWSKHERLRYPLAEVAGEFLNVNDSGLPKLVKSGAFWWGLALILFIRCNNGLNIWMNIISPGSKWLNIPMTFNFGAIMSKWPILDKADVWSRFTIGWWGTTIYPTIAAIAFLLATDVSFTIGIAPYIYLGMSLVLIKGYGVYLGSDGSDYMMGGLAIWQRFGSYLALTLMILYIGRQYYSQVLARALTFRKGKNAVESYAAWACRIGLLSMAGIVAIFMALGLNLLFALMLVCLIMLVFIGMTRINCESGLFLSLPRWQPLGVMLGLCGAAALGPHAIALVALISVLFTAAPLECVMPFFLNGLKVCTDRGIRPSRAGTSAMMTYVIALAIAVPVVLWATHNYGLQRGQGRWSTMTLPYYYHDASNNIFEELHNDTQFTKSEEMTEGARMNPFNWVREKGFYRYAGLGIAGVLILSVLRLRLHWWPLHPILFVIWGTRQSAEVSTSFLLGWCIKSAVTKLGTKDTFQNVRLFMFGAIAGDLLAATAFSFISMAYHTVTDKIPPVYNILPVMN